MVASRGSFVFAISVLSACNPNGASGHAGFVDAPVAAVAAPIAGQVAEVLVREGDHVHRGQVLARLDTRERRAAVAQAEASLLEAQEAVHQAEHQADVAVPRVRGAGADVARMRAALDQAQIEFDRVSRLVSTGADTPAQLDEARAKLAEAQAALLGTDASQQASRLEVLTALAAVRTARAGVARAEAALELARVQLAEAEITSPFDGLVAERDLEPGEWAAPGTPVVTLEDTSRKWVRIDLEETALGALRIGRPARITVVALPGRSFTGRVLEIGAEAEFALNRDVRRGRPDVRTFRVRIAFDRDVPEVRPGMTAEVVFPPGSGRR